MLQETKTEAFAQKPKDQHLKTKSGAEDRKGRLLSSKTTDVSFTQHEQQLSDASLVQEVIHPHPPPLTVRQQSNPEEPQPQLVGDESCSVSSSRRSCSKQLTTLFLCFPSWLTRLGQMRPLVRTGLPSSPGHAKLITAKSVADQNV